MTPAVTPPTKRGGGSAGASNADQQERLRRRSTDPTVLYADHKKQTEGVAPSLTPDQSSAVEDFRANYEKHRIRYEKVAGQAGIPAPLVAAIHWRESTADFGTYLHQGDPLGKAAVNVPTDIPLFSEWEPAAVHALKQKANVAKALAMDKSTTDLAAMATYSEFYNGLGYRQRGETNPYVYSGTDQYTSGKFVSDGRFSASTKDRQVGVLPLVESVSQPNRG